MSLMEFTADGKRVRVDSLTMEYVHYKSAAPGDFLTERAQKMFGSWPVYIMPLEATRTNGDYLFKGYRVFASCYAEELNLLEKLIVVFHTNSVRVVFPDVVGSKLQSVPWASLREVIDI